MNFPHLPAGRDQHHVRQFRWADRREFTALPRLEEDITLIKDITNSTDSKECHYETQGAEPGMRESFPSGHIPCSENNRHFLGEIPHFRLLEFAAEFRSSHAAVPKLWGQNPAEH